MTPSSRGLGHRPFTAVTGVRIPVGSPMKTTERWFFLWRNSKGGKNPVGFGHEAKAKLTPKAVRKDELKARNPRGIDLFDFINIEGVDLIKKESVQPIADPKGNPIGPNARSDTDFENIKMLNSFVKRKILLI